MGRFLGMGTGSGSAPVMWLGHLAGVLVLLCGAAHCPLGWFDAPSHGLAASLGVSALCPALGVALCLSRAAAVAAAGVVVPGALAAAHLLDARVDSATLAYVLDEGGAVSPLPALSAALAAPAVLAVAATPGNGPPVRLFHPAVELARCRERTAWTAAVMRVVEQRSLRRRRRVLRVVMARATSARISACEWLAGLLTCGQLLASSEGHKRGAADTADGRRRSGRSATACVRRRDAVELRRASAPH